MSNMKKDTDLHEEFEKLVEQSIKEQKKIIVERERGYQPPIYFNEPFLIVHVVVRTGTLHRIWANSVHVECQQTNTRYKLKGILNVSQYPALTAYHEPSVFTLLFDRPDSECTSFNLVEDIAEHGGLVVLDVVRNDMDVYFIRS